MPDRPINPETTLEWFAQAVQLLGGQRATARYLDVSERNIRYLLAGDVPLHDGFLRDTAAALVKHANQCRMVERHLFGATVQSADPEARRDRRRYDHREQD